MTSNPMSALYSLLSLAGPQQSQFMTRSMAESPAKSLAYGAGPQGAVSNTTPVNAGSLFRVERGAPFLRAGKPVFATPQFKALTIYSPTAKTAQLPSTNVQSVALSYPTKTK